MNNDLNAARVEPVVSHPVTSGNEVFDFLSRFSWWEVRRVNSGNTLRILVSIRLSDGDYVKVHGRVGETVCNVTDRLRLKLIG